MSSRYSLKLIHPDRLNLPIELLEYALLTVDGIYVEEEAAYRETQDAIWILKAAIKELKRMQGNIHPRQIV